MTRLLTILLLCVASATFAQQRQLGGVVTDSSGEPLAGVTVKLFSGSKLRTFARTGSSGRYLLKIPESDSLRLSFERMSYAKIEMELPQGSELDVQMNEAPTEIREVVITAPSVRQRGDTLSFNVAAFLGKGDISLEDALKKIPGITVEGSGAIKYMGRDISNFYVEGLEMLGGRYSLATRSLPADYVSTVEVLSNHKHRKMDAGKHSDDVALNVKLKSTTKIRPVGTYLLGAGYEKDRMLYQLGGTAMVFRPKFQTLVNVKGGNITSFASSDLTVHYGAESRGGRAEEVLPAVSAGRAPVSASRYDKVTDWLVSANTIQRTGEDATLRVNASYGYSRNGFGYSTLTSYFTGEGSLDIEEMISPVMTAHKPSVDIDYTLNSDKKYLSNSLTATGEISAQELAVLNNSLPQSQDRKMRNFKIRDNFNFSSKIGNKEWNFASSIAFDNTPAVRMVITANDRNSTQTVRSSTFSLSERAYASWRFNRSVIYLPVSVKYDYDDIKTDLRDGENSLNRVLADVGKISVSPSYTYEIPDNKFSLSVSLPVSLNIIRARNRATSESMSVTRPDFTPDIYLFYKLNGTSEFTFSSGLSYNIGDILSLLGNPVQTSFRNYVTKSGIIARNNGWRGNLGYKFQRPFEYWFVRANLSYSSTRRNTLMSSYITEDKTFYTDILSPNTTDMATAAVSFSKTFMRIHTKLDLKASGSWSRRETMQQDIAVRYYGRGAGSGLKTTFSPVGWLSVQWSPEIAYTVSSYRGSSSSYTDFSENFKLSLFPGGGVELSGSVEHVRTPVSTDIYKNIALTDFNIVWKHGKWRWTVMLANALNCRHYRYTVFSGLDTRRVDYRLRGRSLTASATFTL